MIAFRSLTRLICIALIGILPFTIFAKSEIHFSDYKILLTDKKPSFDHKLFNQGNSDALCEISFIDYLVSSNGKLSLPEEGVVPASSAKSILRASPRRVKIPANSTQKVKVIARNVRKMPDGEKTSYLSLRCKEANVKLDEGVSISPVFVFNIPVTVRKGDLTATAKIINAKYSLINNNHIVEFEMNRQGTRSLYGDISVSDASGVLARMNGNTHYLGSTTIPYRLTLTRAPEGKLTIKYKEQERFNGDIILQHQID